jgi:hypothetical protein
VRFLSDFNQNRKVLKKKFVKVTGVKFQEKSYDGLRAIQFGQTYGRTNSHDESNSRYLKLLRNCKQTSDYAINTPGLGDPRSSTAAAAAAAATTATTTTTTTTTI